MREVKLDTAQIVPEIDAHVRGPRKSSRVHLVFDTGSGVTQLDTKVVENIGYSARDAARLMSVRGATGEAAEGYIVNVRKLVVFGIDFENVPVLAYDFDNFPELDGLLGFDVIKQLHLEVDGPRGLLRIFN